MKLQLEQKKPWQRRLLAEATRINEESSDQEIEDKAATARAISRGGSFEKRLLTRAENLSEAEELSTSLDDVKRSVLWVVVILLILALAAGLSAAKLVLFTDAVGLVNFYWILLGLLGLPTLSLVLWLLSLFLGARVTNINSLGGLGLKLSKLLAKRLHRGSTTEIAILAWTNLVIQARTGRWLIGTIVHAIWLAFIVGSLLMTLLLLSTRQYDFTWETTILSDGAFLRLTEYLSILPATFGFTTPDTDLIVASRLHPGIRPPAASRDAWSGLLFGSILIYGALPRLLSLGLCLLLTTHLLKNTRLNLEHHGFARLHSRLIPVARVVGVVDPDTVGVSEPIPQPETHALVQPIQGEILVLGIDIDPPTAGWPPPLSDKPVHDLGLVTDRESRKIALEKLEGSANKAGLLVVVCSLTTTPDRGIGRFIRRLLDLVDIPTVMLLTQGEKLRQRIDSTLVEQRLSDWQRIGVQHGLNAEDFLEVDLDDSDTVAAFSAVMATRLPRSADPTDQIPHETT